MEFNQLESFLSVVKHKSFSKAAKALYLTQPTISNNIQNLENELSTSLLDRKSKRISLTDSGKEFYKYAVELVNLRDQSKNSILEHMNKLKGEIRIHSSSIPAEYILPTIIKKFNKLYPGISFSVYQKNSQDIIDDILNERENFGIVGAKTLSRNLEYIEFYQDELVLAMPYKGHHTLSSPENMDLPSLLSKDFLIRDQGSGTRLVLEKALIKEGFNIDNLQSLSIIDSNEMIKRMVSLDLGISFLSKISLQHEVDFKLLETRTIDRLDLKRNFYFVYNKNRTLSPIVDKFKDFFQSNSFSSTDFLIK